MLQSEPLEKRRFHRVSVDCDVVLVINDHSYQGSLVDVSLKGLMIVFDKAWSFGIGANAIVQLISADLDDQKITMHVELVRINGRHMACECISVDFKSAKRLKQLMALKHSDPELLNREFSTLIDHFDIN